MNGRGIRASPPPADHAAPEVASENGLLVHHHNRRGMVRSYDFSRLPVAEPMQRSLAVLFAARCVPHRWSVHASSQGHWYWVKAFAELVATVEQPPADLDELTAAHVKRWRLGAGSAAGYRAVAQLLRQDPRLRSGPAADELGRRIALPASKVQSYAQVDFDQVKLAAQRDFRAALQRIRRNAAYLQRWRAGAFDPGSREYVIGEALDLLARTGDLPRTHNPVKDGTILGRYRSALGGCGYDVTWKRLFLSSREAVSLGVLLMATFGWNLSVIDTAEVPRALPDQGTDGHPVYRIPVEKFRRGPRLHFETRNVADDGAASKGRLITEALDATRYARAVVEELTPGTDLLVVWRAAKRGQPRRELDRHPPVGKFRFGIDSQTATKWGRGFGLDGSPFQRGRRTVLVVDRREPAQHSQDTHDRNYALVDKRVQAEAIAVVAAGADEAVEKARTAILEAQLVAGPLAGDVPTAIADCQDMTASPLPTADGRCAASFLMCLGCQNAHIHPGHHPRLAYLHQALGGLRSALPAATWQADWADSYTRLEDLKGKVGATVWNTALTRMTEADRDTVGLLLTGDLDA